MNVSRKLSQSLALLMLGALTTFGAQAKTLDLLVLYTPQATQTWEGRDIEARVQSFVEYFNRVLVDSDTDMNVRLVHTQVMDWTEDLDRATGYNLNRLANDARANALRNQYGADIVSLVYANPPRESCGIGRIATGKNGQLYNWSASGADGYNLSAVNCYIHIIAHETGHNMGLRHSPVQDQQSGYDFNYRHSGTHLYSRGYGVNGLFVTPMAYPSAYGSWNVQPVFSNPRKRCEGQPCGVVDHADAAWALRVMADQITGYRPTQITDNPTDPEPTGTIYDFQESIAGWSGYHGNVAQVADADNNRKLRVSGRGQNYSGAIGNISGLIEGQASYQIEGDIWIANNTRNNLTSWLYVEDHEGQYRWLQVARTALNGNQWHQFGGDVRVELSSVRRALLYVYGPNAEANMFLDNVSIQPH